MDRFHEGRAQRQVRDLRPGDRVDLQNNEFADPLGFAGNGDESEACARNGWAYEFAEVLEIEPETAGCIRVDFNNFSCGFPPDHWIDVDGEQEREGV